MEEIVIDRTSEDEEGFEFRVCVIDGTDRTVHDVSLTRVDYEGFDFAAKSPERIVELCFGFLLEREPKESIHSQFELRALPEIFPEFRDEVRLRIVGGPRLDDSSTPRGLE
jgi:hypothetical protein